LRKAGLFVQDDLLACALLLVARLSETKNSRKLGDALNKAEFSSLRFANLVRCEEPADLFINLQRAVRFCENSVDPFDLVRLVLGWTDAQRDSTRKKLIAQFYAIA
jgi:CRISPR type I-E-associated protein CasB/Cse2